MSQEISALKEVIFLSSEDLPDYKTDTESIRLFHKGFFVISKWAVRACQIQSLLDQMLLIRSLPVTLPNGSSFLR